MRRNRDLMGGLEGWDQGSRAKDDRGGAAGAQSALVGGQGSVPHCSYDNASVQWCFAQTEKPRPAFIKNELGGAAGAARVLVGALKSVSGLHGQSACCVVL
jgi:hypothetical protein